MTRSAATRTDWTGELVLELRNGRDWSVGDAEVSVHRDTVIVRHVQRCIAVMDRDQFRAWLSTTDPGPLAHDDAIWSVQAGMTFLAVMSGSQAAFRVTPESLRNLVAVI